ncbi:MAG: hypothetical protein QM608_22965 [Caulobacter sp.]
MSNLFRIEASQSRRRKIYGTIRLWQSNAYKTYLLLTLAAIPTLLGLAWLTPYAEKVRFTEVLLTPSVPLEAHASPTFGDEVMVRFVTPFPVALPASTLVQVKIEDPSVAAQYAVTATVLAQRPSAGGTNKVGNVRFLAALHLDRGQDQALAAALREHRSLQGTIILPRSNLLSMVARFALAGRK